MFRVWVDIVVIVRSPLIQREVVSDGPASHGVLLGALSSFIVLSDSVADGRGLAQQDFSCRNW